MQSIFAYVQLKWAGGDAGDVRSGPASAGSSKHLDTPALPGQLRALRSCKTLLIAAEVGSGVD